MNASALLQSQGWLGKGHSLDSHRFGSSSTTPTQSGRNARGLVNPLLISRNTDGRGIGNKTHYTSDQWWLSAFDQKLKGLDTTNSKEGITQTVTEGKLDAVGRVQEGKYTGTKGLYAFFVKGGLLEGTVEVGLLGESKEGTATPDGGSESGGGFSLRQQLAAKRAKREAKKAGMTKEERKARKEKKEAKRLKREEKVRRRKEKEGRKREKEERRRRKELKRKRRAEKDKKEK
ncbi:uncharacterized protein PODANS_1_2620 [Podospora anserina S mat+]|uniref:Podospora anserina S mat+ genomic DNA chromosome 1, supercontig 1 n=1 Tax=Podospora anserina (strain S / ATCC MYA-4624 / DSM 980 / FGSC 10383) TaxID=515849 RepID=B2AA28_PODAN|nr:uncharacterized protein PODANS_1_2620 [Podospora anserina S mat+]CAP59939.1 unnamed protein product [Podospora anserina S mat+]CDP22581.1 Putative protein of unknown function [Podospora anserina S mat+]